MDFEEGMAMVEGGFDPAAVSQAIRDAGFGPGEISLTARGAWSRWDELPALVLPGRPELLILAGGSGIESLLSAELPDGTALVIEGVLHPAHGEHPAGVTVSEWRRAEASD